MKLKNLFTKILGIVVLLTLLSFTEASAQYFVSNDPATGASDGRNGLAATKPTPDDGITGPKLTLSNAIAAATAGQNITVSATGLNYTEAAVVVNKNLTIIASGGTPVFTGNLQLDADLTLQGSFQFNNLNLASTDPDLSITGTLTLTGTIAVNNATASVTGTLAVTGAANHLTYNVNFSQGNEFPATGIDNLILAAGVTVDLNATREINGVLTVGGAASTLDLDGFALTVSGTSAAHALGAGSVVTDGTLVFNMVGGGATIAGAGGTENLPNVSATSTAAQTLNIGATIEAVDNLTAGGAATIAAANTGDIDDVTNNGSGAITTAQTIGGVVTGVNNVTLAGSGNITLNHTAAALNTVTGSILVSGTGTLTWGGNVNAITVTGNVSLTSSVSLGTAGAQAGLALITFTDVTTTVNGTVSNSFTLSGTPEAGPHNNDGNGLITFQATNKQVTLDGLSVSSGGSPADNAGANSTSDNNGNILFSYTTGAGTFFNATTVSVSSSWGGDATESGKIDFTAGAVNGPIAITTLTNTSTSTVASCGYVDFGAARTGNFTATSLSTSGSTVGGDIIIGNPGTLQVNGSLSNTRTVAGADITVGSFVTGAPITAYTNVVNSVISTAATPAVGDVVTFSGTTSAVLNGNYFVVTAVAAGVSFTINNLVAPGATSGGIYSNSLPTATVNITGTYTNSGASNVTFLLDDAAAVTITGSSTHSSTGSTNFQTLFSGGFSTGGLSVSNGQFNLTNFTSDGANNLSAGAVNLSSGSLNVPNLNDGGGAAIGNFTCTSFTMSGGAHTISGVAAGGTEDILVGAGTTIGNVSLTGGTLDLTDITLFQTNGTSITIGGTTGNPTFTVTPLPNAVTFTLDEPIPNVLQTVNIGNFFPLWPGHFNAANPANIPVVTQFTGGNLRIMGNLTFNTVTVTNSIVLNGAKLYLGDNAVVASGGTFANTTGYTTTNDGRVVMSGSQAQQVTHGGAGRYFGGFEVDNNGAVGGGNEEVFIQTQNTNEANALFIDFFYLAEGTVEGRDIEFVSVGGSVPHVVRNDGSFADFAPTFTNTIDVTYIGLDKVTALELPGTATGLRNLTIATTNSVNVAGRGVVQMGGAATVNGTLQVNTNQTLYLNGNDLTMAGATVQGAGDIAGNGTADVLILARAAGVSFTGFTGYLPSVEVANNSLGNVIPTNIAGILADLLGADAIRDNGNDDVATLGNIDFTVGADNGSALTVNFTGAGPHFAALNMAGADQDQTLTLGSNARLSGNIALAAGTLALGDYTLTHSGTAPGMTGGASITSNAPGRLLFNVNATTFTVTAPAATIGANVEVSLDGNNTFTLAAGGANLAINGTLTLSDAGAAGGGAVFNIGGGRTLTAGGNVTVGANCAFGAPAPGTGILLLDAVTAPLTYTTTAATAVPNLTVADDVVLAGGVLGSTLTVNTAFNHTGGNLNIGSADLILGGNYTRTAGTYSGTGFMVWNSAGVFTHGPALAINNLRVTQNLALVSLTGVTVNDYLHLNGATFDHTPTTVGYLTIGDGVGTTTVEVTGGGNMVTGGTNVAPTFVGTIDYLYTGGNAAPNNFTWPATQANNVTLNMTGGGNTVTFGGNHTINGNLDVTLGDLVWDTPDVLTIASGSTITRRDNGSILNNNNDGIAPSGTLSAANVNLAYQNAAANINAALEYTAPTVVNNFTLLPIAPNNNTTVTIANARTISGTLSMASVLNINANTSFTLAQTIPTGSTVNVDDGVTVNWLGGLAVNGTYNNNSDNDNVGTSTASVTGDLSGTGNIVNGLDANDLGTFTVSGNVTNTGGNITNNVGSTFTVTGTATGTFALINNGAMTLGGMTQTTGATTLGAASTTTFTGNATFGPLTVPAIPGAAPAVVPATISTNSNLTFVGAFTGTLLNLTFTGTNTQTVALGANQTINNLTMNKGGNQTVTFSGGNVTLNGAVVLAAGPPAVTQAAGVLTLTRGVLVIGNITPGNPALLTIQLTTNAAGVITNLGYVRNPAAVTDLAHVLGRLGVALPVGTTGRSEWPVGSATLYRPAAITFLTGNATIAPTTIIVEHVDGTPAGTVNFPINGGTKFNNPSQTNWLGGKGPYAWKIQATTSLGASQLFDLELQGTNINRYFETVNDLRIIRRFDGDINVNGWFGQGNMANYSNIMQANVPTPGDTLITVRNVNSQGGIVTQAAFFTFGIPSQRPVFTATMPDAVVNEGVAVTPFAYQATDPDAVPSTIVYSLVSPTPTTGVVAPTINSSTGVFNWTPDFTQGTQTYTVRVRAAKSSDPTSYIEDDALVTVNNVNRAPSFTAPIPGNQSIAHGSLLTMNYTATDLDAGDALTFTLGPGAPTGVAIASTGPTSARVTWTPTFAQVGGPYPIQVIVTDNGTPNLAANTTANITVTNARLKGDVNNDGFVIVGDATLILQHVVGLTNAPWVPITGAENIWAADIGPNGGVGDGVIGALDAARILFYVAQDPDAWPTWKVGATNGTVAFGDLKSQPNSDAVTIPLRISSGANVFAASFTLNIDKSIASLESITSNLPEGWQLFSNFTEAGELNIALAGTKPLPDGDFANVTLKLASKESKLMVSGFGSLNDELAVSLQPVNVRQIPAQFDLSQNYPNPFNPTTTIKYQLASNTNISLVVYDMLGRKVRTLVNEVQDAGYYSITWNGLNDNGVAISSGLYIYRIEAGSYIATKKMSFIK